MADVYLGAFSAANLRKTWKEGAAQAEDLRLQTGDTGTPQADAGAKTPTPTDVVSDKPFDVGGGVDQKADPNAPPPKKDEGDGIDDKTLIKFGTPLLILGAAAIYYFYFYKKKK